jgi:uncharacterized protein (DUF924 family)
MLLDPARAEIVVRYWFDGASDAIEIGPGHPCYRRWFGGGVGLDAEIQRGFGADMEAARAGACPAWDTPRERLALVLLLDQVPRHVYRGDGRAFASDRDALALARWCIADGSDEQLALIERVFLYLPIQHSEQLPDHDLALERYEHLVGRARERRLAILGFLEAAVAAEHEHIELLRRFGRYPGRNAALGRISTAEERAHLDASSG